MGSEAILVTDGDERAALAVVRSLGTAGYRVIVGAQRPRSLAGASRWASARVVLPDPLRAPGEFTAAVREVVVRERIAVVLPIAEPALLAVSEHRNVLAEARLPWPSDQQIRAICDKAGLLATARGIGLRIPEQVIWIGPNDRGDSKDLTYPLVVKPARSVSGGAGAGGRFKLGVSHAATPAELDAILRQLPSAGWPVLLQQRVIGPGVGQFVLRWDGRVRAVFAHRRIREKPPWGGVSVYREAIAADPALLALSTRLLEAYDWQGVAMVEYKVDAATGTPYLMEVNGRFWGSLQLAVDAGVDFPRLLVEAATGVPSGGAPPWKVGVRSRWWWGDVDHLLARLRRSDATLALPPGAPSRARTVWEILRPPRRSDVGEIFRWGDPGPAWRETLDWFRRR